MSLWDVLVAAGLLLLVCILASAGPGWDLGLASEAGAVPESIRLNLFYVGAGALTVAVLLAEHGRRTSPD